MSIKRREIALTYRRWNTHAIREVASAASCVGVGIEGSFAPVEIARFGFTASILCTRIRG